MNKEDYSKYYIQGSDHYLIPRDIFEELFDEMSNWREEVKELKEKYLNAVADYETTMFEKEQLNSLVNSCQEEIRQLKKQNDSLKQKLNWIAFGDDSELALRYLRKIGYVDFDEERKVYINKHNNEPFLLKDEQEKDYYIKDNELNEYTEQLKYQIKELKKQLEYLRSGEYYNQLRFENEMLQQVVDTNGVPSEVYDYIDCTHRNTELLEENQELKKQLEVGEEQYNDLVEEKESLQEQLSSNTLQLEELKEQVSKGLYNTCLPYSTGYNKAIKDKETQQKEFIEYMNKTIEELECDDVDDEEMKDYLIQRIDTFKEILSKFKKIIGSDINVGSIGGK